MVVVERGGVEVMGEFGGNGLFGRITIKTIFEGCGESSMMGCFHWEFGRLWFLKFLRMVQLAIWVIGFHTFSLHSFSILLRLLLINLPKLPLQLNQLCLSILYLLNLLLQIFSLILQPSCSLLQPYLHCIHLKRLWYLDLLFPLYPLPLNSLSQAFH